uniref:Uncharacterized protein n=1 Tax=Ditylenchus dipsaci TaxID=166011 RepID=A0A915E4R7_9BILA
MAQPTAECPDTDRIKLPPEILVFETLEELNAWIYYEDVNNKRRLIEADRRCSRDTLAPLDEDVNASNRQMLNNIASIEYVFFVNR